MKAAVKATAPEVVRQPDPKTGRVWFLFVERPSLTWIDKMTAAGWKSMTQRKAWYHPNGAAPPIGLAITEGRSTQMPSMRQAEVAGLPLTGVPGTLEPPPADPPAGVKAPQSGDLVILQRQALLVRSVSGSTLRGYYVGGGNDGYKALKVRIAHLSGVLKRATPALLAALEHRQGSRANFGDQRWRDLMAAALLEPIATESTNQEGAPT